MNGNHQLGMGLEASEVPGKDGVTPRISVNIHEGMSRTSWPMERPLNLFLIKETAVGRPSLLWVAPYPGFGSWIVLE